MSITFTPTGLKITSAEENIRELEAVFKGVFGDEINLAPETPQGQLIASFAAIITDKDAQFLEFVNNLNPGTAEGFMQDALAALYLISRKPATYSTVTLSCFGREGVTIPAASEVKSEAGALFSTTEARTIPAEGVVLVPADAEEAGAIVCPAGSINRIVKPLAGWDSVTNEYAAIPGAEEESRSSFEERRKKSVAGNATGSVGAVYAAVANLDNVTDCVVHENKTDEVKQLVGVLEGETITILLPPHSLFVVVAGGDETDIANAVYSKKSAGCDLYGNTEINVYDEPSGADYLIKFERPEVSELYVKVSIFAAGLPTGYEETVKTAIYNNFYGADGGELVRIGSPLYSSRFYSSLNLPGIRVIEVQIRLGEGADTYLLNPGANQMLTLDKENITVNLVTI
jgi:hypothetical protein